MKEVRELKPADLAIALSVKLAVSGEVFSLLLIYSILKSFMNSLKFFTYSWLMKLIKCKLADLIRWIGLLFYNQTW